MLDTIKQSLSVSSDTSSLDFLVTCCVFFAIFIGFTATIVWIIFLCLGKPMPELGMVIGMCATFLSPFLAQAASKFAYRPSVVPPIYPPNPNGPIDPNYSCKKE